MDRKLYKRHTQEALFSYPNVSILESSVEDLILSVDTDGTGLSCSGIILGKIQQKFSHCVNLGLMLI